MYPDELMDNQDRYHIFVPSDPALQKHFLEAYHDSPLGMHRGCDAAYQCRSHDFYWHDMLKHVCNWVRQCPHCIQFNSLQPAHGLMQIRLYQHPLHTLGVNYVGELPKSPSENGWILTAVCLYSNYFYELFQFWTEQLQLQPKPNLMMFFCCWASLAFCRVIAEVNF